MGRRRIGRLWRGLRLSTGFRRRRGSERPSAGLWPTRSYIVLTAGLLVLLLVLFPERVRTTWIYVQDTVHNGVEWLAPTLGRSLVSEPEQAVRLVVSTLPRFQNSDHERPPSVTWAMTLRSWIYAATGYDVAQPTSFLEVELPGYAAVARQQRERLRTPMPPHPGDDLVERLPPEMPVPPSSPDEPPLIIEPEKLPVPGLPDDTAKEHRLETPQRFRTLGELLAAAEWGDEPLIAVLHTHPSEMYRTDTFAPSEPHDYHLFDTAETGIIRVGARLVETLWQRYGIPAVHDTTLHNTPCHSCAYRESRKTVEDLLRRYPSLLLILDVHRDGAENVSMLTTIDDEAVAQVAVVVGRPSARDLGRHPRWSENDRFANELAELMVQRYPGLFRRVLHLSGVYNQDLHPRFLLLEVGNYYDHERHALRAAELLADVIAEALYITRFGPDWLEDAEVEIETDEADYIVH